jgi:serine protease Do
LKRTLSDARGAIVAEPEPGGPAKRAGIDAGDIITAVNGKHIADSRELARSIGALPPGSSVKLTVVRKGQEKAVTITLGELPDPREAAVRSDSGEPKSANIPQLGFSVAPKAGSEGVVVTDVDADGTAAEHGLKTGDVILDTGGKKLATAADLRTAVQAAEKSGKRTVLMRVKSGTSARYVTLPVGRG